MRKAAERALKARLVVEFHKVGQAAAERQGNGFGLPGIIYDHEARLLVILRAHYTQVIAEFGGRAQKLFSRKSSTARLELKAKRVTRAQGDYNARMAKLVDKWTAEKVTMIGDTTKERIKAVVEDGEREGWSAQEIASEIESDMDEIGPTRAEVIARTETHTASQSANLEVAKDLGIPLLKQWVATNDDRTRSDHADADMQTVGMEDPFIVGGEELEFPGDPAGSAENTINCRCICVFVDAESQPSTDTPDEGDIT